MTGVFIAHLSRTRRAMTRVSVALVALVVAIAPVGAWGQNASSTADPTALLQQNLPKDVAARVLALVADARTHGLPADALLQRALKFAARGIAPANIERSVAEHANRMARAKLALERGRSHTPTSDEIEAGSEALREGVDGSIISALAKSAPPGRSLAVPLYVIGNLTARGLPADQALARVQAKLAGRATDAELEALPGELSAGANRTDEHGASESHRQQGAGAQNGGGPPAGVPGNAGAKAHPPHPVTPGQGGGNGNGQGNGHGNSNRP